MSNNTDLNADQNGIEYNKATEGLIIISQTVFFLVLFTLMKSFLLERLMNNPNDFQNNTMQIVAIYFSIVVFITLLMTPMYHYKYAVVVVSLIGTGIVFIIYRDVRNVWANDDGGQSVPKTLTRQLPVKKQQQSRQVTYDVTSQF